MADVVSIELLLDEDTETRVRQDWRSLEDAGLSSLGAHRSASNRPHITMLVRAPLVRAGLATVAFDDAVALLPVRIELIEPMTFPHGDRTVLAWRVAVSDQLSELHRVIHAATPPDPDLAHTAFGEWTPHITLARRLRLETLPQALGLIGEASAGTGVSLRRWDSASATVTSLT